MDTETIKPPRTRQEVEALKANWAGDPCWDLEKTGDGFESYHDELLAFSEQKHQEWDEAYTKWTEARREAQRTRWGQGIPDAALDYMAMLEERLQKVEDKVSMIKSSALYTE